MNFALIENAPLPSMVNQTVGYVLSLGHGLMPFLSIEGSRPVKMLILYFQLVDHMDCAPPRTTRHDVLLVLFVLPRD